MSARDRFATAADGGGGGGGEAGSSLPEDDRFTFGDAAQIWVESIPFVAVSQAGEEVTGAAEDVTSGDAGLGDALGSIDFGSGAGDETRDVTGGVGESVDQTAEDAAEAADEATEGAQQFLTGPIFKLLVGGLILVATLFLLRPVLGLLNTAAG